MNEIAAAGAIFQDLDRWKIKPLFWKEPPPFGLSPTFYQNFVNPLLFKIFKICEPPYMRGAGTMPKFSETLRGYFLEKSVFQKGGTFAAARSLV